MGDSENVHEDELSKLKEVLQDLEEAKQDYQEQVRTLQDEVQQLEDILDMQVSEQILSAQYDGNKDLEHFVKPPSTDETELIEAIDMLEKKLRISRELTNITIDKTKFTVNKLDVEENVVARKHTITGHSGDMPFVMECNVIEPLNSVDEQRPCVTEFQTSVIPALYENIGESFNRFVTDKNISGTFQLIGGYSRWSQARQETFEFFTSKYPNIVRAPQGIDGKYLVIEKPQLQYIVTWEISGESILSDIPALRLGLKILGEGVTDKDERELKNAPEMFEKMLKSLGIERAITTLVELCKS